LVRNAIPLPLGLGERRLARNLTCERAADLLPKCIEIPDCARNRQFRVAVLDTLLGVGNVIRQFRPLRDPICRIGVVTLAKRVEASDSRDIEISDYWRIKEMHDAVCCLRSLRLLGDPEHPAISQHLTVPDLVSGLFSWNLSIPDFTDDSARLRVL